MGAIRTDPRRYCNITEIPTEHLQLQKIRAAVEKLARQDIVSLGGTVSPNNAGAQVVAGVEGQRVKVYDAGYHSAQDGLHYFYFGTSSTATTKRFCTSNLKGLVHKTFVQPRVGDVGDGLYLYSALAETNMPIDVGYVQEP